MAARNFLYWHVVPGGKTWKFYAERMSEQVHQDIHFGLSLLAPNTGVELPVCPSWTTSRLHRRYHVYLAECPLLHQVCALMHYDVVGTSM